MGGGLETGDTSHKEDLVTIYPSEIRTFAYCPRLFFFESWLGKKARASDRLRALVGRLFHALWSLVDKIRGFKSESLIETVLGGVRLRGRPDSYLQAGEEVVVVERKSGRGPVRGAWLSDVLQASAYALILSKTSGSRKARVIVRYRRGSGEFSMSEELVGKLVKAIDDMVYVKKHGVVPAALRSEPKCGRCPYRMPCEELDRDLSVGSDLYEPGSWLSRERRALEDPGPG